MKHIYLLIAVCILAATVSAQTGNKKVKIITDSGTIIVRLFDETPKHRDNFIKLVKKGFYDSLLFHRVIKNFMIQGGDPESKNAKPGIMLGNGDVGYRIPAEFNDKLFHKKGMLAAARDNNPEKASSGCQFYIVQGKALTDEDIEKYEKRINSKISEDKKKVYKTIGGTPWLDNGYTVFGEVIKGLEVIDKIANAKTDKSDRPLQDIHMRMKIKRKFLFF